MSGTLVYGQTFAQAALGYEVTGFVGRDTQGNSLTVTDGVEYILADAGVNGNELHVRAGGYALTLKAEWSRGLALIIIICPLKTWAARLPWKRRRLP